MGEPVGEEARGATRRKNQDYTKCLELLPEGVWSRIMKAGTDRQRAEEVAHFCYTCLGLRLPSEPTFATLTSLLAAFAPDCSSFDLRSKYETVKNVWVTAKARLKRSVPEPARLLDRLPASFDELPEDIRESFGTRRPFTPWPISSEEVERQFLRVPMRKGHSSLKDESEDPFVRLASLVAAKIQPRAARGQDSDLLSNLKIFTPSKRTAPDTLGQDKLRQLAMLTSGDNIALTMSPRTHEATRPAEDVLVLSKPQQREAGASAMRVQSKATPERTAKKHEDHLRGGHEPDSKRIRAMSSVMDAGQEFAASFSEPNHAGTAMVPFSFADQAAEFLKARGSTTAGSGKSSKGETKKPQGLKRPAGCMKRPASQVESQRVASQVESQQAASPVESRRAASPVESQHAESQVESEEFANHSKSSFVNMTFEAKRYGSCKVEFYTHKSYVRYLDDDGKWRMILGSTHEKHQHVCALLVPHIKKGLAKEALLKVRQSIVDQLDWLWWDHSHPLDFDFVCDHGHTPVWPDLCGKVKKGKPTERTWWKILNNKSTQTQNICIYIYIYVISNSIWSFDDSLWF